MVIRILNQLVALYEEQTARFHDLYKKTVQLASLKPENEPDLEKINLCLAEREKLMQKIDTVHKKTLGLWRKLAEELDCDSSPEGVLSACPCQQSAVLVKMHGEMTGIALKIKELDEKTGSELHKKKEELQEKMKNLQRSRRARDLYRSRNRQQEGVFIDWKKY